MQRKLDQEQYFFFKLVLIEIFFFNTFSIFEISNPPNLNIVGLLNKIYDC